MNNSTNKIFKGTFGEMQVIPDFLPSPEELAKNTKPNTTKVTLTLDEKSVQIFKQSAKKHGASYQRMIRNLVTSYAKKIQNQS